MSASPFVDLTTTECSVCTDDFVEPKMLPCGHHFCKNCILGWLQSEGWQATCPFCRTPIFSSLAILRLRNTDRQYEFDHVMSMVDAMPTNHGLEETVKARQVLRSPNVCNRCVGTVAAVSYCFHCETKMCADCLDAHKQTKKSHPVEAVDYLTETTLTGKRIVKCKKHPDRQAEFYCYDHNVVMCGLCVEAEHQHSSCFECASVKVTGSIFRSTLQDVVNIMKTNASTMAYQIKRAKDSFQETERGINEVFDDLEESLELQRQALIGTLQAKRSKSSSSLETQKITQGILAQHSSSLQTLVFITSDGSLAHMLRSIREQVMRLYRQISESRTAPGATFTLNKRQMKKIKADIDHIGHVRTLVCSRTPAPTMGVVRNVRAHASVLANLILDLPRRLSSTNLEYLTH